MIKKTLCILSLLSISPLLCMTRPAARGSETVTVTNRAAVSTIVTQIEIANDGTRSFEDRFQALVLASAAVRNLGREALTDTEIATLSRALSPHTINSRLRAIVISQITAAISQIRNTVALAQIDAAPAIPEDATTVTRPEDRTDHFTAMAGHAHRLGTIRNEERSARQALEVRIAAVEENLRQSQTSLRTKEEEAQEYANALESLTEQLERTSLSLAEQTTNNLQLHALIEQTTRIKRRLEANVETYRQRTEELEAILRELQELDE